MTFSDKLRAAQARTKSWLCIGLDTDPDRIPAVLRGNADAILAFNRAIVDATLDLVCAFKPNLAFYLQRGSVGLDDLAGTIAIIPRDIPIILDAKFGDIESSARGYAHFAFDSLGVDGVTANPYLGADALAPFLDYEDRAIFLLAHTSNPSAGDFQDAWVATSQPEEIPEPLFVRVARFAARLKGKAHVGLVVGATYPEQLCDTRAANPHAVLLVAGIGAQGGSLPETARCGKNDQGLGPLINASRSILYASSDVNFAQSARTAALKLRDEIHRASGEDA